MILKYANEYVDYIESLINDAITYINSVENFEFDFEPTYEPVDIVSFIRHLIYERNEIRKCIAKHAEELATSGTYSIYSSIEESLRNLIKFDPYSSGDNRKIILDKIHEISIAKLENYKKDTLNLFSIEVPVYTLFDIGDSFEDAMDKYINIGK